MPLDPKKILELYEKAEKLYLTDPIEAEKIYEKLLLQDTNQQQIVRYNIKLGSIKEKKGENEEARKLFLEAKSISEKMGYQFELAEVLHEISNFSMNEGKLDKSIKLAKEALNIFLSLEKKDEEIKTRTTLAYVLYLNAQIDEARNLFDENIEKVNDKRVSTMQKARLFNSCGCFYESEGNVEKTTAFYEKANKLFNEIGATRGICVTLANLGESYLLTGEMKKAENAFLRGIAIAKKYQYYNLHTVLLGGYANYFMNLGDLQSAQIHFEKSMKMLESTQRYRSKEETLYKYSLYWMMKGNTPKAKEFLLEALKIIKEFNITDFAVEVLTSLSEISLGFRNFDQANSYLQDADQYAWKRKSDIDFAKILIQKSRKELVLQQLDEAKMNLTRANWISESKHNLGLQINTLLLLTLVYLNKFQKDSSSDNFDKAMYYITKSIDLSRGKGLIPKLINSLIIQGMLYSCEKNGDKVKLIFEEAISLAEQYNIPNLVRISKESYAFSSRKLKIKKEDDDKNISNNFYLQIAIDEIKSATRTFNQKSLKSEDLNKIHLVLFKVDEIKGPDVVLADNLDPYDTHWHKDLILSGALYASALGQGHKYHEGLFGFLPFGGENLRAMVYAVRIKDGSQKSFRQAGKAYFLFTLIFPEDFKHLFLDRQQMELVFSEEISMLEDASELTQKKLIDISNHVLTKLTKDLI
ncbi:hypothetical protein NEF87_000356 [Candidatus Lokiarchaeum ossiferum]|uniref:MalT-like TPR region domain-containing protein n=1 Tax=Candidatus Lokiarchaeum ossiferum TaxID=2951803 RepID=A0ABY6HND8_9ARCH|nr:hypothetical protein NEF87_000356 [Candidatus Lokiarchaeum sp. B-35]